MTQQDIVKRLNQLTIKSNLTWEDIKWDADKAIAKINAYMGATYPNMSDVLLSPDSRYAIRVSGVDHPYFPEEHIHSIVLPFIAMEVLARDEEFTTIYNKYLAEFQDGLFDMFQKEFNKVPLAFRQQPDQGVFFASKTPMGRVQRNQQHDLPVFKFRIHYHINNSDIWLFPSQPFTEDATAYEYNAEATVLGFDEDWFMSHNGLHRYKLSGWHRNPETMITETLITAGASITMRSDIHLYAQWEKKDNISVDTNGVVTIVEAAKESLRRLVLPDAFNGRTLKSIPTNFTDGVDALQHIELPPRVESIGSNAFRGDSIESIIFPQTALSPIYTGIDIGSNAFAETTKLLQVTLYENVVVIAVDAFPEVVERGLTVYTPILVENTPNGWAEDWDEHINVVWGYHG